jgi:hypothetical protein
MDQQSLNPPDYHRCKYCQNALVDCTPCLSGFQGLVSRQTTFLMQTKYDSYWPVLKLSISLAREAIEAGCALFQPFRHQSPYASYRPDFSRCHPSDTYVQILMRYMRGVPNRWHGKVPRCSFVLLSGPSKTMIGDSLFSPMEIFAPRGNAALPNYFAIYMISNLFR